MVGGKLKKLGIRLALQLDTTLTLQANSTYNNHEKIGLRGRESEW